MDNQLKIAVMGAGGRMGRMVVKTVHEAEGCAVGGAIEQEGSALVGQDAGALAGVGDLGVALATDPVPVIAACDAVIDFTAPAATMRHAELAAQAQTAYVAGTTGLDGEQEAALARAARHTPVVYAPNMSVAVNLLFALTERVARVLGADDYDIEIVEMHHRHKVDAPSGTALGLGRAAARGRDIALDDAAVFSREGHTGARVAGTIGFATLRGGDAAGDHSVVFAGAGERLELTHRATDRRIFARGAVRAARWAQGREPALYTMLDVLGLGV